MAWAPGQGDVDSGVIGEDLCDGPAEGRGVVLACCGLAVQG